MHGQNHIKNIFNYFETARDCPQLQGIEGLKYVELYKNHFIIPIGFSYNNTTTNYLTPWSRVLPENMQDPQLVKKFPVFYATRKFI